MSEDESSRNSDERRAGGRPATVHARVRTAARRVWTDAGQRRAGERKCVVAPADAVLARAWRDLLVDVDVTSMPRATERGTHCRMQPEAQLKRRGERMDVARGWCNAGETQTAGSIELACRVDEIAVDEAIRARVLEQLAYGIRERSHYGG